MKKFLCILLAIAFCLVLPGCTVSVNKTTGADIAEKEENVDVDLTILSSTMVYSQVYDMMMTPEDFMGKVIKMNGTFAYYKDESTGKYYYACIIKDATACCSQGIEFELNDSFKFPDDYPEAGDDVTVIGTFDTYQEGQYIYCTLRDARML